MRFCKVGSRIESTNQRVTLNLSGGDEDNESDRKEDRKFLSHVHSEFDSKLEPISETECE